MGVEIYEMEIHLKIVRNTVDKCIIIILAGCWKQHAMVCGLESPILASQLQPQFIVIIIVFVIIIQSTTFVLSSSLLLIILATAL